MKKPIADKAEVALEYPSVLLAHSNACLALRLISIRLALRDCWNDQAGDTHKSIHMHINFGLFADILMIGIER